MAVFKIRTQTGWMEVPIAGYQNVLWSNVQEKPFSTLGPKFTVTDGILNVNTDIELVVVDTLPDASSSTMGKIYLVPAPTSKQKNIKDEYVTVRTGAEGSYTYSWEQIGSTSIDLSQYYTKTETNTLLNSKQNKLTAGDNITISEENIISAVDTVYTAGEHVSIENKVISVTDIPTITASTIDLEDGVSPLATGALYLVYEE